MLITDLDLDSVDAVVTYPLTRTEAQPEWVSARNSGLIPSSLFSLYCNASFLSFGSAPQMLRDEKNQLFGYFGLMVNSLRGTLSDAREELEAYLLAESKYWDYGKEFRGEVWETGAEDRANKHFRLFILSLTSSLDLLAELVALLLPGMIPGLKVGKSDFDSVVKWLKVPLTPQLIASVLTYRAETLHSRSQELIVSKGESQDWLPLLQLIRNKGAHFGLAHFREMRFHNSEGKFFAFMPRVWPLLWEEHVNQGDINDKQSWRKLTEVLMRQDKESYAKGLLQRVWTIVDVSVQVLNATYIDTQQFERSECLLRELESSQKSFSVATFENH